MGSINLDYIDEHGIRRRVLVSPEVEVEPSEGVPVSLPVDELYEHMPIAFRQRLMEELWNNGLIEPGDFLRPGAAEKIRAVWLSIVKKDVFDIQQLAKERSTHDK